MSKNISNITTFKDVYKKPFRNRKEEKKDDNK